jgi:hypothetical protein
VVRKLTAFAVGVLLALCLPTLLVAQGGGSVQGQIQAALRAFTRSANSWSGRQTFNSITVNGTCTGCGGGGGGIGGSIANTQVAFGVGTNIGGSAAFTWSGTNAELFISDLMQASAVVIDVLPGNDTTITWFNASVQAVTGLASDGTFAFTRASAYTFDNAVTATGFVASALAGADQRPVCFHADGSLYAGTNTAGALACP